MKNLFYLLSLTLFLVSCSTVKQAKPYPEHQTVLERNEDGILITETFSYEKELALNEPVQQEKEAFPDAKSSRTIAALPEEISVSVKDTVYIDGDPVEEALYSEKLAKKAFRWSFTPLLALLAPFTLGIFLLWIPVGIIMTSIFLRRIRKLQYVTQEALDKKRKAKIALILNCIGVVLIFAALLLIVLLLLAFTF